MNEDAGTILPWMGPWEWSPRIPSDVSLIKYQTGLVPRLHPMGVSGLNPTGFPGSCPGRISLLQPV